MTLEEIRQALSDRNLKEVSRLTGIHYTTVYGIATGKHINPTYQTFKTLEAYINGKR